MLLTLQWLENVIVAHASTAVSQTTFSNAFSWMKKREFRVKSHRNLLLRLQLTISQHWFRYWLGAEEATSHYLNQCWPCLLTHTCVTLPRWVKQTMFEGGRQHDGFFVNDEFVFPYWKRSVYQCISVWRNDTKRQIHAYISSTQHIKWYELALSAPQVVMLTTIRWRKLYYLITSVSMIIFISSLKTLWFNFYEKDSNKNRKPSGVSFLDMYQLWSQLG